MTTHRRMNPSRLLEGAGWLAIAYGMVMLVGLLFAGWLLAVLLLASWGISVWVPLALLVLVAAAFIWRVSRTAGLIRLAVTLAIGGAYGFGLQAGVDSEEMIYVTTAAYMLAVLVLPNLVVKVYERSRSSPLH
jgi:hypothetical protein